MSKLKEYFLEVKQRGKGNIAVGEFTVTYDKQKEVDNVATFGPWSIYGEKQPQPTLEHMSQSEIENLGIILDIIREIE